MTSFFQPMKYKLGVPLSAPAPAWEKLEWVKLMRREELVPVTSTQRNPPPASPSPLSPWMALIDMNSYFAVLEQQANPYLRNRPVGIVKDQGRSCLIAASPEAKKLGIKTGCSLWDARKLCPNIITVAADFDKYFHNTKLLKSIFESLSPNTDIFSLDEAFLDLSSCRSVYPTARDFFQTARQKVKEQLGEWVTFSLGIGANRLQAKLASEFAGKNNFFEMTEENLDSCLATAKVEDICGIGFRLSDKLHRLSIEHPYQLNFFDDAFLQEHFGVFWGPELRRIGQGKNSHLLDLVDKPFQHMKSVGRSKTLYKATDDREHLRQLMFNLAEDMCFKARRMSLAGQHVGLSIHDTEGGWYGNEIRIKNYVRHTDEVFQLLNRIFDNFNFGERKIIKVSVRLGNLKHLDEIPLCWLPEWEKKEKVFAAIDKVNEKHGLYTVKSGRLHGFKILYPEVTGFLGDKTYQFEQYT
jgi:DNA polymerase-4